MKKSREKGEKRTVFTTGRPFRQNEGESAAEKTPPTPPLMKGGNYGRESLLRLQAATASAWLFDWRPQSPPYEGRTTRTASRENCARDDQVWRILGDFDGIGSLLT